MTSLWTVNTVLTILKVRRGGLEDGEEGPTTLPEATALSAYTLPVPALNWKVARGSALWPDLAVVPETIGLVFGHHDALFS